MPHLVMKGPNYTRVSIMLSLDRDFGNVLKERGINRHSTQISAQIESVTPLSETSTVTYSIVSVSIENHLDRIPPKPNQVSPLRYQN